LIALSTNHKMKGKILVVEDDEDLQNMYAEILESNEKKVSD